MLGLLLSQIGCSGQKTKSINPLTPRLEETRKSLRNESRGKPKEKTNASEEIVEHVFFKGDFRGTCGGLAGDVPTYITHRVANARPSASFRRALAHQRPGSSRLNPSPSSRQHQLQSDKKNHVRFQNSPWHPLSHDEAEMVFWREPSRHFTSVQSGGPARQA